MTLLRNLTVFILFVTMIGFGPFAVANGFSNVAINGQQLTVPQLRALEASIGSRIAPGIYLVDARGCWANLSNGTSGCLGNVQTFSRYGSGERSSDGSWNHYSNSARTGVGGTADGCIYTTTGWSNC